MIGMNIYTQFICLPNNIQGHHQAYPFPARIWASPINAHRIYLSFKE
jgi:hypothetical protein